MWMTMGRKKRVINQNFVFQNIQRCMLSTYSRLWASAKKIKSAELPQHCMEAIVVLKITTKSFYNTYAADFAVLFIHSKVKLSIQFPTLHDVKYLYEKYRKTSKIK